MKKYLLELKYRAFFIFFNFSINVFIIYFYKDILLFILIKSNKFDWNYNLPIFYFIFTDITEIFKIYFKMIFFLSFQIFLLMLIYHFFLFLNPALFMFERSKFKLIIKLIVVFWFLNILFAHNILIPITWNFFFNIYNITNDNAFTIHFESKLSEYFSFYISLYYLSLLYLYLLLAFVFFFNFSNLNNGKLKKFRKIYYFSFFLFSTLISPPDVVSQCILSILLIFLYEIVKINFIFKQNINKLTDSN